MNVKDAEFKALLNQYRKFTVYGLSDNSAKPNHYVPVYMRERGWDIVGTYPEIHSAGGFKIYESLGEVPPEYRKFIDVFRSSQRIPDVVDEALEVGGIEVLWLQLGISNPHAERRAEAAGIRVVSDRCLIIEHRKWFS